MRSRENNENLSLSLHFAPEELTRLGSVLSAKNPLVEKIICKRTWCLNTAMLVSQHFKQFQCFHRNVSGFASSILFTYPGFQRLFMRGFQFRLSLKKWPARKASGPQRHPFDSAEPITTPLIPKRPESGCFADWFLGDIECFNSSDWITITTGACSGRECLKVTDQIKTIQAHITYVFAFWTRVGNIRCLYEQKI